MTAEATGPSLVLLTVTVKSWVAVAPASISRRNFYCQITHISIGGRAGEGLRCRIEAEPGRQRAAIGKRRRQGKRVAHVNIGKAAGRNCETEARILVGGLVGNSGRGNRAIIGIVDRDLEVLGSGGACGVGCGDADGECPNIAVERRAGEGLGCRIEYKPGWQRTAIGKCCRQGEAVAHIDIGEAAGRNCETEASILIGRLVGNDGRGDGAIIGIVDGDGEVLRCVAPEVSVAVTRMVSAPTSSFRGRAGERLGCRIETEPGGQRAAVGKRC